MTRILGKEYIPYKVFGLLLFVFGILVSFGLCSYLVMNASSISDAFKNMSVLCLVSSSYLTASGMLFYASRESEKKGLLALGIINMPVCVCMLLFTALIDRAFIVYALVPLAFSVVLLISLIKKLK